MTPPTQTPTRLTANRRRFLRGLSLTTLAIAGSGTAAATPPTDSEDARNRQPANAFPTVLPLPDGFRPEGIATGRGHAFFVGSLAGGAIYRGDLRTGAGTVIVPPASDRVAVGLSHDDRRGTLFVAGGPTGRADCYDTGTGTLAASYQLTPPGTFVNDVIATRDAAYFTDSFAPRLYRLPLGPGGRLPGAGAATELPLGGDFEFVPGAFNANGIAVTPDGAHLVVVNSTSGALYRVDPATGDATSIDLGGTSLPNGDGLLLAGHTLYVVQNRDNRIAVVDLDATYTHGIVVDTITSPDLDVPTTAARFGAHLYAVNARFGVPNPGTADYEVVRVPAHPAD